MPLALRYLLPGQMKFMAQNGFEVLMVSADGNIREELIQAEGCPHVIVPMTRKITPLQDLYCLIKLIILFARERPHIVHTHTPKAGLLGMLAAKICFVKIRIHTVAGLPLMVEKGFKLKLLRFIEKLTYTAATQVWPNSPSLYQYILNQNWCSPHKLGIIGKGSSNGVDSARFNKTAIPPRELNSLKKELNYNEANTYLLFVGRMVHDKGIVELVSAFQKLQNQYAQLRLILAGPFEKNLDPLPLEIEKAIETNAAIHHIGWTDKVEHLMAIAHFFVFPSHREGFPNVLLQAAVMQLPIICSNIPGNIDIVTHNSTGIIFESGNETGLEEAIGYALQHNETSLQMSKELYQFVSENFMRNVYWQNLLNRYNELLQSKN